MLERAKGGRSGRRPEAPADLEPDRKYPLVGEIAGLGNQLARGLWQPGVRHRYQHGDEHKRRLKRPLPQDLDQLAKIVREKEYRRELNLHDPQSGEKYGYAVKGESSYELCAEFSLDDKDEKTKKVFTVVRGDGIAIPKSRPRITLVQKIDTLQLDLWKK